LKYDLLTLKTISGDIKNDTIRYRTHRFQKTLYGSRDRISSTSRNHCKL